MNADDEVPNFSQWMTDGDKMKKSRSFIRLKSPLFRCYLMPEPMDNKQARSPVGYEKPPWIFKGSALYQLHLVKAETARAFIPKDFRLVEAFGYTLGGFFLASYDDSPAGKFDEALYGTHRPLTENCSVNRWAARVLVSSDEACIHGRKDIGLPSQVARFSKTTRAIPRTLKTKSSGFFDAFGKFVSDGPKSCRDIQVTEIKGLSAMNLCNINFSTAGPELESSKWMGPHVKMSLPSYSGRTKHNSRLLKYACQIECRVRAVAPAKLIGPPPPPAAAADMDKENSCKDLGKKKRSLSISVLLSKPILALEFNCLEMKVEAPTLLSDHSHKPLRH